MLILKLFNEILRQEKTNKKRINLGYQNLKCLGMLFTNYVCNGQYEF